MTGTPQPPSDGPESSSENKACVNCAEPIRTTARLCKHCNTYQDVRRWLPVSSTVLALLVACISVLTAALPVISEFLADPRARLTVSSPTIRGGSLFLVASNTGKSPAVIKSAWIESNQFKQSLKLEPVKAEDVFIEPGTKQVQLVLKIPYDATGAQGIANRIANTDTATEVSLYLKTDGGRDEDGLLRLEINENELISEFAQRAAKCGSKPSADADFARDCGTLADDQEES